MATNKELEQENADLRDENERLRGQLAEARSVTNVTTRPGPVAPSFGISEGTRADLEQVEKTTDPFTGKLLTRDDLETRSNLDPVPSFSDAE